MKFSNTQRWVVELLKHHGSRCHYCGCELDTRREAIINQQPNSATVDHKRPQSKGGRSNFGNLVLACYGCNQKKADMDYEDFLTLCQWQR
jgi:5-methylcytosine-specific restriction endonuclease McrA